MLTDAVVAAPGVGADLACALHVIEHEVGQDVLGGVRDALHPHSSGAAVAGFYGDRDQGFAVGAAPAPARFDAADDRLVDLDRAREQFAAGADHRAPELVKPRPRGLIAAQAQDALQPERADALLLIDDVPDGREPTRQRRPRAGEDRARRHRRLAAAHPAAAQAVAHLPPAAIDHGAKSAHEPVPPAQLLEVAPARCIVREPGQQLMPVARIVNPRRQILHRRRTLHRAGYRRG